MTTYYTKSEEGEFSDATEEVNNIVKNRLHKFKESSAAEIRTEVEAKVRDELTESITKAAEDKFKSEFQPKLDEVTQKAQQLETSLRQKTIAAEYGFKPGTEKYLGNGTEEEMRKEADLLKSSFNGTTKAPDKETGSGKSATQQRTGIKVEI